MAVLLDDAPSVAYELDRLLGGRDTDHADFAKKSSPERRVGVCDLFRTLGCVRDVLVGADRRLLALPSI